MAEVNLSAEQLNKLKAAMARAKGLDPQAALQQPTAAKPAPAAGAPGGARERGGDGGSGRDEDTSYRVESGGRYLSED